MVSKTMSMQVFMVIKYLRGPLNTLNCLVTLVSTAVTDYTIDIYVILFGFKQERQRNDNAVSSNISSAATAPVPPPAQSATSLAGAVPPASIRSVPPPTHDHSASSPASGRGERPLRPQPPLRPQTPLRPQPPTYDNVMNPPSVPHVTQRPGLNPNAVSDEHSQMEVNNSANGGASSGGVSNVDSTQSPAAAGAADVGEEVSYYYLSDLDGQTKCP